MGQDSVEITPDKRKSRREEGQNRRVRSTPYHDGLPAQEPVFHIIILSNHQNCDDFPPGKRGSRVNGEERPTERILLACGPQGK